MPYAAQSRPLQLFEGRTGEIAVLLTDDATIRAMNAQWRGIDKPTNVLSFPAGKSTVAADTAPLGDIAIACETVAREAATENKAFLDHLAHLSIHGYLHLIGFDHETDSEAERMEHLETRILASLGIADPYADRTPPGLTRTKPCPTPKLHPIPMMPLAPRRRLISRAAAISRSR